jgi:phosphatidate cytidylyltransferase
MARILTALLLIPGAIGAIFYSPQALFVAVAALLAGLCYWEYAALVRAQGGDALLPIALVSGLIILLSPAPFSAAVLLALLGMAFALRGDLARSLVTGGGFALGLLYVFGSWRAAIELREASPHWLFFAIALNWAGDTAAMYAGKAFGRRKLAPHVSPGKTVEGAVASLLASALLGVAYMAWAMPAVPAAQAFALAVAGNVAGQFGDLAESALKRGANLKDSGTLLPGHGGVLDRMDSSLFSMPMVLGLLQWLEIR